MAPVSSRSRPSRSGERPRHRRLAGPGRAVDGDERPRPRRGAAHPPVGPGPVRPDEIGGEARVAGGDRLPSGDRGPRPRAGRPRRRWPRPWPSGGRPRRRSARGGGAPPSPRPPGRRPPRRPGRRRPATSSTVAVEPVGLLHPELARPGGTGSVPRPAAAATARIGHLVEGGDLLGLDHRAVQPGAVGGDRPGGVARLGDLDGGPHPPQHAEEPEPLDAQLDVGHGDQAAGDDDAADQPEGCL